MIGEFENPWWLTTPSGTLYFNYTYPSTNWRFQLVPADCNAILPVRSTEDDKPQADGKIPHRRWRSGYGVHLVIDLQISDNECAGGADLVGMLDLLGLHLNEMIRTGLVSGFPNARLIFTPTGHANRMFDRCQLLSVEADPLGSALGGTRVTVDIDTPYPYYIEETETQTFLSGTGPVIVNNAGNTDYFSVAQIDGDTTYFELINHTVVDFAGNPLKIVYFAALPGAQDIVAPDYVEIVFYNGTAYLNGSGAKRIAGVDMRYTDLFPLVPGDNALELVGATGLILSNGAWA